MLRERQREGVNLCKSLITYSALHEVLERELCLVLLFPVQNIDLRILFCGRGKTYWPYLQNEGVYVNVWTIPATNLHD